MNFLQALGLSTLFALGHIDFGLGYCCSSTNHFLVSLSKDEEISLEERISS